jgi:hypothetical protein
MNTGKYPIVALVEMYTVFVNGDLEGISCTDGAIGPVVFAPCTQIVVSDRYM